LSLEQTPGIESKRKFLVSKIESKLQREQMPLLSKRWKEKQIKDGKVWFVQFKKLMQIDSVSMAAKICFIFKKK
jgi:hypothetical protein